MAQTANIATLVGDVWTIITGNPVLLVMTASSLLAIGFAFFRKAKRAAR